MISVIMTAYNTEEWIRESITSVLSNTYKDIELIVINDASTDGTEDVIKSFTDERIRLYTNEKNMGAGMSRRKGIELSRGEYIQFMDSDDFIDNDFYENLMRYEGNDFIESKAIRIYDFDGNVSETDNFCFLNTCLVKSSVFKEKGVQYSKLRYIEDVPTKMRIKYAVDTTVHTDYVGYNYRQREGSLVHTKNALLYELMYNYLGKREMSKIPQMKNDPTARTKPYITHMRQMGVTYEDILPYLEWVDDDERMEIKKELCD